MAQLLDLLQYFASTVTHIRNGPAAGVVVDWQQKVRGPGAGCLRCPVGFTPEKPRVSCPSDSPSLSNGTSSSARARGPPAFQEPGVAARGLDARGSAGDAVGPVPEEALA